MIPILLAIEVSPLLDVAWDIMQFAIDYVWVFCLMIFFLVMSRTVYDLAKKVVDRSRPGVRKLITGTRRRS